MPLKSGKKSVSKNISHMLRKYLDTGKIGNVRPESAKKARQVAIAAALTKLKKGK